MYLDKAKKEEIFGQYGKSTTDTGSGITRTTTQLVH